MECDITREQEFAREGQGQRTVPKHCSPKRMTALPPIAPTFLEINAEQVQQAPFEGVPNYWLPRKPNHQPRPPMCHSRAQAGWWMGGSLGLALCG